MVCRWEPDLQERIVRQWNVVSSAKYKNTWKNAKQYAKDRRRPKWMQVRHYWKCVRYWKLPDVVKMSIQNSKNRGVVYDEAGNPVSKAMGTHISGTTSMHPRTREQLKRIH